jgi:hypothetical protein
MPKSRNRRGSMLFRSRNLLPEVKATLPLCFHVAHNCLAEYVKTLRRDAEKLLGDDTAALQVVDPLT